MRQAHRKPGTNEWNYVLKARGLAESGGPSRVFRVQGAGFLGFSGFRVFRVEGFQGFLQGFLEFRV